MPGAGSRPSQPWRHVGRSCARAGATPEREVVEEIKARHPRYAWVGFTDETCRVRVSTGRSIDGTDVEERPWCREARKAAFVGDVHDAVLLRSSSRIWARSVC